MHGEGQNGHSLAHYDVIAIGMSSQYFGSLSHFPSSSEALYR